MEGLASDNPWNPASRDFWGSEPENKVNLLFIVGILGLFLIAFSFVGFMRFFGLWVGTFFLPSDVPIFHGFVLLLAIKMKSRPSNVFRAVLGLLVIWSIIRMLFMISWYWGWYDNTDILGISLLHVWMTGITFLLWKHAGDREFHGPNPNALMIFIFVTLIIGTYITWSTFWWFDPGSSFYLLQVSKFLGFPLFWGAFTLLYIYRTEIEPWEDASTSYDLESQQTRSGISAYNASKLKEAKELLDNRVISEKEFQEIKDEYLN